MSNLPKIGDYDISNEMMLKLMTYVAVPTDTELGYQTLSTRALVINHVPDWEILGRIEKEMVAYNASFFQGEKISSFFEDLAEKFLQKIFEMYIPSSAQSSQPDSQASTSSEPSTT